MFNKETEYAIRGLVYIQTQNQQKQRPGIDEIAREIDAPRFFTAKILQRLVKQGFLTSQKGKGGGFQLPPEKSDRTLKDVIVSIEGDHIFTAADSASHCGWNPLSPPTNTQASAPPSTPLFPPKPSDPWPKKATNQRNRPTPFNKYSPPLVTITRAYTIQSTKNHTTMSELINNSSRRKETLKALILKLHDGEDPIHVRYELKHTLKQIPYNEVVEVEQELMEEGLPQEEVLRLCDVHGQVLDGFIDDEDAQDIPEGHPIDVFLKENEAIKQVAETATQLLAQLPTITEDDYPKHLLKLQSSFNELMDIDKHYQRKEYLLFPYLEKKDITGPPKVMWGKHDEIREQLKGCIEVLRTPGLKKTDLEEAIAILFTPVLQAMVDMTKKEADILFPMAMDHLTLEDWWHIHQQTLEFGFTLIDPVDWKPEGMNREAQEAQTKLNENGAIQLPSGSFTAKEIMAILNTAPFDMTFVDKNDKVKYFTQGRNIFTRNRSIINRDVRLCHPRVVCT